MLMDIMANDETTNQGIEGNERDPNRYPHRVYPNQHHDKAEHLTPGKYPHRVIPDNRYSRIYPKGKVPNGLAVLAEKVFQKAKEDGREGIFLTSRLNR